MPRLHPEKRDHAGHKHEIVRTGAENLAGDRKYAAERAASARHGQTQAAMDKSAIDRQDSTKRPVSGKQIGAAALHSP